MSYIKIYNKDLMPIGVISTDSIEVVENGERYAKIKNAEGLILGAINIDSEISPSEIQRLVTIYNEKMIPVGFADIANVMPKHDYSKDYFTTEALENGTIAFNIWKNMGTDLITSISYSMDNGETWTTVNNENNKEENLQIEVDVEEGDKILWKCTAQQLGFYDEDEDYDEIVGSFFSSTCDFNAYGNVMSMLYGDNFSGRKTLSYAGIFAYLFKDYNSEQTCFIKNASNISLSATTLAQNCYSHMFAGCTSLTAAPELPATTLAQACYNSMFVGCTSLTSAPELPATTLVEYCYDNMFRGCTSLTSAPELPATTLASSCYVSMFQGCTSLTTAPELLATTLAQSCYSSMFYDCTSLTAAPELPATTLVQSCYNSMFYGCTSLTTAPELPATTLANYCYQSMFQGCTSLITASELPATTLVERCYASMFYGCTSLNYIKALFTTTPSNSYTSNWVKDVAANGTFVKSKDATWSVVGNNGVPTGWTIETA